MAYDIKDFLMKSLIGRQRDTAGPRSDWTFLFKLLIIGPVFTPRPNYFEIGMNLNFWGDSTSN